MNKTYLQEKIEGQSDYFVSFDESGNIISRQIDITGYSIPLTVYALNGSIVKLEKLNIETELYEEIEIQDDSPLTYVPLNSNWVQLSDNKIFKVDRNDEYHFNLNSFGTYKVSCYLLRNGVQTLNAEEVVEINELKNYSLDFRSNNTYAIIRVNFPVITTKVTLATPITVFENDIIEEITDSTLLEKGYYDFVVTTTGQYNVCAEYNETFNSNWQAVMVSELNGSMKTVEADYIPTTLNNVSWDLISAVSSACIGESYWSVGDMKEITLNSPTGTTLFGNTYSNNTIKVFIIGFNHNYELEGSGLIHFQFGYESSSDKYIGFYQYSNDSSKVTMNTENINAGGWKDSEFRNNVCKVPSSLTGHTAVSDCLFDIFPEELQKVLILKHCSKYTDNSGNGILANCSINDITVTFDSIFLLSVVEMKNHTYDNQNSYEINYTKQYDYYKNKTTGELIRYFYRTTASSARGYFLRSRRIDLTNFYSINSTGNVSSANANVTAMCCCPAFVV